MNTEFPLVTIITPSYNRASFLKETIESILSQDYPNIEYIVLDDGSTDNTREILEMYSGGLIWESHPNMGEQRTVNKGYQMAKGEFIAIVNSDDPLRPGAVKACVLALMDNPEVLGVYPDYDVIGPDSKIIRREVLPLYDLYNSLLEFRRNGIGMGPGLFIRRKTLELIEGRDPKYRYVGDIDFLFRLMLNGKLIHISQVLATHRIHADAASRVGRGRRLADELIWTIENVLEDPKLPAELTRMRIKLYSDAHHVASWWCGRDISAMLYHQFHFVKYLSNFIFEKNPHLPLRKRLAIVINDLREILLILREFYFNLKNKFLFLVIDLGRLLINSLLMIVYLIFYGIFIFNVGLDKLFSWKKAHFNRKAFALVSSYLPPQWSGGAVIIERLLHGVDPNLYCLISQYSFEHASSEYIERLPAKYHKVPEIHWAPSPNVTSLLGNTIEYFLMHLFAIRCAWHIAWILKREACSRMIGTTGDFVGVLADYYAARLANAELYLYYFDDYVAQWWADKKRVKFARKAETFMVRKVKGFLVPNEYMSAELSSRHGIPSSDIHIIRNPCSTSNISDEKNSRNSSTDEIKIIFTGAIYHVNYDSLRALVQAIDCLNDLQIRLHLYTAQPIEILEKEGIKGENVVFHEHVPPTVVAEVQKRADILLLPFTFHPDALDLVRTSATAKLADYLATGKPILAIVPPDTYIDWYLKQYECGIAVNCDDPVEIANAITRIVQDKELSRQMGINARARVLIDFDPLKAQQKFLEVIGTQPA